jgi:precorrin-6Y C5,15-methyltransferase (decarboxylating)
MTAKIHIIGVSPHGLTLAQRELLGQSALIVGGERLLALFGHCTIPTVGITPLAKAIPVIEQSLEVGDVAVLASGDPLFYGIGRRLLDHFSHDLVEIHPTLSSMQDAACRFKVPWDDAILLSLHGRSHKHVAGLLLAHPKSFMFTDPANAPDVLARDLITYLQLIEDDYLLAQCRIMVAENIGGEEETLFSGTLQETADHDFTDLNVMCLLCPVPEQTTILGLTEQEIVHSRGLITKDEVRAATLHRLCLPRQGVFWDIGAGSGSVSIEAARLNPELVIYAIERKEEELANIKANIRRFGCYNVIPVAGLAMDVLEHLPTPQRVFIGGNGGQLPDIIQAVARRLPQSGLLVANGVIEQTIEETPKLMAEQGLQVETSCITVSRTGQDGVAVLFNPITIIAGGKVG